MLNITPEQFKEIQDRICMPVGTFWFDYHSTDLFDKSNDGGIVLEIPSGQHLFRLERDKAFFLHYYHYSPGTGTRVASIDLNSVPASPNVFILFSWSPEEIKLTIRPREVSESQFVEAIGVISSKQFRVGADGRVYQFGDHGVVAMGFNIYEGGKPIVQPTALEAWKETVKAIDILETGQSSEGFIYEVVITNLTLAVLVTGFEAYTKKRYLEIEQEGVHPDTKEVIESFYPKGERDAGIAKLLEQEAIEAKVSVLQQIVSRNAINFQSFNKCKLAYNKAYGIKFGDLEQSSVVIKELQSFFQYRHKIIHISALLGALDIEVPSGKPVISSKKIAQKAKICFGDFIDKLHQATLRLR